MVVANQEIADFYKQRFPSQNSQIYSEFGKLAAANGVRIETVRYKPDIEGNVLEGLEAAEMDADLAGSYTSLARFINALERDEMFFIINTVTLGNDPRGPVKLSVRLETYLKTGTT